MKLRMADNSLFAILLRTRWWVSLVLAAVMALVARLVLPKDYEPLALFSAIPFLVVAGVAAWRQFQRPSPARVADTLKAVAAMPWPRFAALVEQAFRDDGHTVARLDAAGADFEVVRAGRVTLVSGRRWKAARTGVEPLRELHAAMTARGTASGLYIALAAPTEAAAGFAREHGIEVMQGDAIAMLLRRAALPK